MSEDSKTDRIGDKLKRLRETQGRSRREVAAQAGISTTYLSRLEAGQADNPSIEVAERLAAALNVSAVELMGGLAEREMPTSLPIFLGCYEHVFEELKDPDWIACLSEIRVGGRTPTNNHDWLSIFVALKGAFYHA